LGVPAPQVRHSPGSPGMLRHSLSFASMFVPPWSIARQNHCRTAEKSPPPRGPPLHRLGAADGLPPPLTAGAPCWTCGTSQNVPLHPSLQSPRPSGAKEGVSRGTRRPPASPVRFRDHRHPARASRGGSGRSARRAGRSNTCRSQRVIRISLAAAAATSRCRPPIHRTSQRRSSLLEGPVDSGENIEIDPRSRVVEHLADEDVGLICDAVARRLSRGSRLDAAIRPRRPFRLRAGPAGLSPKGSRVDPEEGNQDQIDPPARGHSGLDRQGFLIQPRRGLLPDRRSGSLFPHSMNFPDFTWSLNFDGLRCTRTDLSRDPGEGLPISACPGGHCVPSGGLAKVPCRRRLPIAPSWVAGGRIAPVAPSLPPARGEAIARPANVPAGRPRPP
jgi:hypothetical protein